MAKKKATKKKPVDSADQADKSAKQQHYDEIREKNREFRAADLEWHSAKLEAAELKKRRDRISNELCEVVARGPNPQMSLFDIDDNTSQKQTVVCLGLSDAVTDALEDAGIKTIGDLQRYWKAASIWIRSRVSAPRRRRRCQTRSTTTRRSTRRSLATNSETNDRRQGRRRFGARESLWKQGRAGAALRLGDEGPSPDAVSTNQARRLR